MSKYYKNKSVTASSVCNMYVTQPNQLKNEMPVSDLSRVDVLLQSTQLVVGEKKTSKEGEHVQAK